MAILEYTGKHTNKDILRLAYNRYPNSYWERMNSVDSYKGAEILNAELEQNDNYDLDSDGSIIVWKHDKNLGYYVKTVIMRF